MTVDTIIVVSFIIGIFAVFALAVGYAQIQTRGMIAPGARPID